MGMRKHWRLMGWSVCAMLVGCGATREEPAPGPTPEAPAPLPDTPVPAQPPASTPPTGEAPPPGEPSTQPETPTQEPTVPVVQPPPSPGEVPPVSAGLEGSPTLKPVACVPWKGKVAPVRATACEGTSVFANGDREVARYDADSRLLERRRYGPDGTLQETEFHTWKNGHETLRRLEFPEGSWDQIEWAYDDAGRLARRTETFDAPTLPRSYQYIRDAKGRLERIERQTSNGQDGPIVYHYNAVGQLVEIDSRPDCDLRVARCETFTYWPNGHVKQNAWTDDHHMSFTNLYDDRGNLVDEQEEGFEHVRHTVTSHDAARRVFRSWEKYGGYYRSHEFVRTLYYDASGLLLLERLGKVYTQLSGPGIEYPLVTTYLTTTRRLTYLCGTKIVWLDEWDSDQDGVVDARRTHERDDKGRLVHEEYSGTPGLDDGPVRRDFKYECD
ncbi:hypothetical protein MEBOL_005811 [Melittangium boletus DSM 14713]|uniref:Uncharacterized protein n=2 Tax=Melittangium boletus TaxID=83453 RepID=A0A250IKN9_9BACT|nr:hypothetical protein MEBOL_005811 [Melittangium boletus DSM 14713]